MPENSLHPFSIYVHVPFCASRCGYCDFNTYTAKELGSGVRQDSFHEVLIQEIELAAQVLPDTSVSTIFFGGGTPTLIGSTALNSILESIGKNFVIASDAEITTEANPDSVDQRMLVELKAGGFTRMSFGMQSVASNVLAVLQRTHQPGASQAAALLAREVGFEHVNLDLIYGTPGETDDDVRASVQAALDSGVDHVSAYSLIVEEGTPLARQVSKGEIPAPDDDVCAERYEVIDSLLIDAGMGWYEVSNWSLPGGECRHNQAYWSGADWWGIGPGAHSHLSGTRWWNHKHPGTYSEALAQGQSLRAGEEVLTPEQIHAERVMLAIRTKAGLDLGELSPSELERCSDLLARGLLAHGSGTRGSSAHGSSSRVRVTDQGRLVADAVVRELLD